MTGDPPGMNRPIEPAVVPPPGNPRFPLVDSMRAIAVLSVVAYHLGHANPAWWGDYAARLNVGVTIFFLISGFLLYRPFVKARMEDDQGPSYVRFARRRILRIVPAYWLVLTASALLLSGFGIIWSGEWWVFYGFAQVYSPETIHQGIAPAWTLCTEVAFYAVLPLYASVVARLLAGRAAWDAVRAELAILVVLAFAAIVFRAYHSESVAIWTLPGMFDWFAVGMGLAVISAAPEARGSSLFRWLTSRPSICWLMALVAFWAVSTQAGLPPDTRGDPLGTAGSSASRLAEHVLLAVVSFFLLVPAVFNDEAGGFPRRILSVRALAWVGLISYGIYLWHQPLFSLWDDSGALFLGTVGLAAVLAVAALSYYLVERPLLALKDPGHSDVRAWFLRRRH